MIKFFRRIRQNLLSENPADGKHSVRAGMFRKYLPYAIGEIILVVIGILIALQINNWNDRKIQYRVDIEFLNNLKSELILDTMALSSQLKWYNELNENTRTTLVLIDTFEELNKEQTRLISKSIAEAEYLLPVQKNINNAGLMTTSAPIKRLNQDLHTKYLRYLELTNFSYDLTTKLANALVTIVNNEIYPSVDLNFTDPTKNRIQFDITTLKNNRTINNALQKSIYYRDAIINVNKQLLNRAKLLIEHMEDVLENNQ